MSKTHAMVGRMQVTNCDPDKPAYIYFTWSRKLRGPRWRKLRRQLRRQAITGNRP